MANLTLTYHIDRPDDSSVVNHTLSLPFINLVRQNSIEMLSQSENLTYQLDDPFPYTETSNITIFANRINPVTNVVTYNTTVLASNFSSYAFTNGTLILQTNQNAGTRINGNIPEYPIYYSVNLTSNITSFMRMNVTVFNTSTVKGVLERLDGDGSTQRVLKTQANRLLHEKYGSELVPSLLVFHRVAAGYHDSTTPQVIRIDSEWNLQSGKYATLIESTNASSRSQIRPIQVVLPSHASIQTTFPLVIYQTQNEYFPLLEIGTMENSTFVATQEIRIESFSVPTRVGTTSHKVDVKLL